MRLHEVGSRTVKDLQRTQENIELLLAKSTCAIQLVDPRPPRRRTPLIKRPTLVCVQFREKGRAVRAIELSQLVCRRGIVIGDETNLDLLPWIAALQSLPRVGQGLKKSCRAKKHGSQLKFDGKPGCFELVPNNTPRESENHVIGDPSTTVCYPHPLKATALKSRIDSRRRRIVLTGVTTLRSTLTFSGRRRGRQFRAGLGHLTVGCRVHRTSS